MHLGPSPMTREYKDRDPNQVIKVKNTAELSGRAVRSSTPSGGGIYYSSLSLVVWDVSELFKQPFTSVLCKLSGFRSNLLDLFVHRLHRYAEGICLSVNSTLLVHFVLLVVYG